MHSALVFLPRPARKETNTTKEKPKNYCPDIYIENKKEI